jgi:glycosyltransferase involved in cell wall biosynthesis
MQPNVRAGSVMHITYGLRLYGAENFVMSLARELDRLGVPIVVLTVCDEVADLGRIPVLSAKRRSRYDFAFLFRMVKLIREAQPSVIHTHGYHGKLWGRLAARMAGVRNIIHTEHNSDFRANLCQRAVNFALHRSTHAIVTFTDTLAERLVVEDRVPKERIVVIPNGVPQPLRKLRWPVPHIDPPIAEGTKLILHVGRLMKVKNQQLAIAACRELMDLRPSQRFCLLLVGAGPDEAMLRRQAASLGIADRVRFLGYRDDVDNLMRRCNVLLITSLNEAMPLTALEAMYAGIPIVSTPWKGAAELLEFGRLGNVAPNYDPGALGRALAVALDDRETAMKIADAAFAAARSRFDIRLTARKHAALYERFDVAVN